jgi:hypothetical protein
MLGGRRSRNAWREHITLALAVLAPASLALLALPTATAAGDTSWGLPTYTPPKAPLAKYTFSDLKLSAGYSASFLAANDNGQAVGLELKGSIQIPIYYDRGTVDDLQPILGNGYLDAIGPSGYAVGQSGGHPVFYDPGSTPITLPINGTANGVTLGPLVGVTVAGSSPSQSMAELWNPYTSAVVPIGNAVLGGIDVGGWAVGQADTGAAWYAAPSAGGAMTQYTLPFMGYLKGINDYDWAFGYELAHGGPHPILVDFTGPAPTNYTLTDFKLTPGFRYGTLLDVNDGGFAVGEGFKDLSAFKANIGVPLVWPTGPDHPLILDEGLHLPDSFRLIDIGGTSNNDLLAGVGRLYDQLRAVMLFPRPYAKLDNIRGILWFDGSLDPEDEAAINQEVDQIERELDDDTYESDDDACDDIDQLASELGGAADYLDTYAGPWAAEAITTYDDTADVAEELYYELRCDGAPFTFPPLDLTVEQSPFYDSALAPGTGTTVTTTVGPPTITGP